MIWREAWTFTPPAPRPFMASPLGAAGQGCRSRGIERPGPRGFSGLRFALTTQITEYDRPHRFSDVLCAGLFRQFSHVYTFQKISETQTLLTDVFTFQSPGGIFGFLFDHFVLRPRMQRVAKHRLQYLKRVAESQERPQT